MSVLNVREIPLTKLVVWEGNVRKTGVETGLDELAASIAAHGLLNPLTVCSSAKGKFAVIAGQRRLLALKRLAKAGTMPKAQPVACVLRDEAGDPSELSLAENVVRVAMHPADQFEAWRTLIERGADVPEIAVRFGVAEATVRKRMALARVSPVIFDSYRDGLVDLEALQAFTVTDDHALQESIWAGLNGWQRNDAGTIRRALTQGDARFDDRRVRFVGLDAYTAAGGAMRRDLFDEEDGGYCQDVVLLDRLVREKLEAVADALKAEGWKWTEARTSFGWDERHQFDHVQPVPLSDAILLESETLQTEAEALEESEDGDDEARLVAIHVRLDEIDAMPPVWNDEAKACAGIVVYLCASGEAAVERGLVRPEDAVKTVEDESGPKAAQSEPVKAGLPANLIEDLTAHKTAALRIELARSPDIALALIVHATVHCAFYRGGERVLKAWMTVRSLERSMQGHDEAPAVQALEAERVRVCDRLPGQQNDLWDWCLAADRETLLDVLAVAAAYGLDAVVAKNDPNHGGAAFGDTLGAALKLDMAAWYRPTAEGYFGRISKAMILSDLEDARQTPCAPSWAKMKKDELAVLAEREIDGTGWMPEPLR